MAEERSRRHGQVNGFVLKALIIMIVCGEKTGSLGVNFIIGRLKGVK
jgi:hypothetical protein